MHYWFTCEEGHMQHSLSAPRQTAWEWETFIKPSGDKREGIKGCTVNCFQVCDFCLLPFSYLQLLTAQWKKDAKHRVSNTSQHKLHVLLPSWREKRTPMFTKVSCRLSFRSGWLDDSELKLLYICYQHSCRSDGNNGSNFLLIVVQVLVTL